MNSTVDSRSSYALVTGASSGIGEAFARRLGRDGYDIVVVARRRERLEALASDLQREHGATVEILVADLTDPGELQRVEDRIAAGPPLGMLVNNAGFGGNALATTDPDSLEAMIRLHVVALTRLTRVALPGMVSQGSGSIVNVSSIAAFRTTRRFGDLFHTTYAATKAFVVTFCMRLHDELSGTGVRVQALCPAWTLTEIVDPRDLEGLVSPEAWMSADDVVQASLAGLDLGEVVCLPSLQDRDLLPQLDRVREAILNQAATTGTLAARYRTEGG